jgi:hypothetical protein
MEQHAHRVQTAEGEKIMALSHRFTDTEAARAGPARVKVLVASVMQLSADFFLGAGPWRRQRRVQG